VGAGRRWDGWRKEAVEGGPDRGVSAVDERGLAGVEEAQRGDGFAEARLGPSGVIGLGGGVVESGPGG
jgi:hypothetical protein